MRMVYIVFVFLRFFEISGFKVQEIDEKFINR